VRAGARAQAAASDFGAAAPSAEKDFRGVAPRPEYEMKKKKRAVFKGLYY